MLVAASQKRVSGAEAERTHEGRGERITISCTRIMVSRLPFGSLFSRFGASPFLLQRLLRLCIGLEPLERRQRDGSETDSAESISDTECDVLSGRKSAPGVCTRVFVLN